LIYTLSAIVLFWVLALLEILDLAARDRAGALALLALVGIAAAVASIPLGRRIHRVGRNSPPGTTRGLLLAAAGVLTGLVVAVLLPPGAGTAAVLVVVGGVLGGLIWTSPKLVD
jgi:hypothetical protein